MHFSYVYRQAAVRTTGCLGDRFELMSRLDGSRADTGTQPCRGIRSSLRSPDRWQCPQGFHSGRLKVTDTNDHDNGVAALGWSTFIPGQQHSHAEGQTEAAQTNAVAFSGVIMNLVQLFTEDLKTQFPFFMIKWTLRLFFFKATFRDIIKSKKKKIF